MPAGGSLRLLTLFGIRIGVSASWFLVLFLLLALFTRSFADTLAVGSTAAFAVALVAVALFFGSILLHELGHALAARREGIEVAGIDLFIFGGVMRMRHDGTTPGAVFRISAAGPLVTLAIVAAGGAAAAALLGADGAWQAARLQARVGTSAVEQLLSLLVGLNVVLLGFNLIPALPLDGGQILRSAVWKATGRPATGTRVAAVLGQGFGLLLALSGVWRLTRGDTVGGAWAVGLGYLVGSGARGAAAQGAMAERLAGATAADAMDAEPVAVPAELGVRRAYEDFFLRYAGWEWFPVAESGSGRFVGLAHRAAFAQLADAEPPPDPEPLAGDLAVDAALVSVAVETPVEHLLGRDPLRSVGGLVAVDAAGRLRGIVTVDGLSRVLRERLDGPGEGAPGPRGA